MAPTASVLPEGTPRLDDLVDASLSTPVALVAWPAEADRRAQLAAAQQPRLLLIPADAAPPLTWDDLEDWVRLPAEADELLARARQLLRWAPPTPSVPVLDADGLVRLGDRWVAVPPVEARLVALLLHDVGRLVRSSTLLEAGWPNGSGDDNLLHSRIRHLRRRLAPLGIRIANVRGAGFLLEVDPGDGAAPR